MSQDYPPLTLDDLVHIMSPSPVPQTLLEDSDMPPPTKSASPEPLSESDVVQMRRKVMQMYHTDTANAQLTPREMELAEMVLRLTAVVKPDSEQLLRQADMISALIQQRDLLLRQAEEQHLRWDSEKDGWARMAEALLAQQAKNRLNPEREEELERLHAAETNNRGIRQRLNETQTRLQILESELTRLRPLLLMQPLVSRSSMPPPTPNPKTQSARGRKKYPSATEDEDHGGSDDEALIDPFNTSHTSHSQATTRAKSRRSEALSSVRLLTNPRKRRPSHKATLQGVSADARVEHLLLAARKIGKHRAGIISGMVQHLEERERQRRREESATTAVATTPKTPKRHTSHTGYPPDGGYVYLNGQIRPVHGMQPVPLFIPAYPQHVLQTPTSSTSVPSATSPAQKPKRGTGAINPPTPLDSLLSVARSMMREDIEDEDEEVDIVGDSPGRTANARHVRPRDMLGSPVPKRRKVVASTSKLPALNRLTSRVMDNAAASSVDTSETISSSVGRVRSALDVLADQAAAFSTQDQSVSPLTPAKGKGKDRGQESSSSTLKSRGRTKSRRKDTQSTTPSSRAAISRSRTPRLDLVDNSAGATCSTYPRTSGFSPEASVDLGEGKSSTTTSNPSSRTPDSISVSETNQVATNSDVQCLPSPGVLSLHADDDSVDATPRQSSRVRDVSGKEVSDETIAQVNFVHLPSPSVPEDDGRATSTPPPYSMPSGGENGGSSSSGIAPVRNKELFRVAEHDMTAPAPPAKRQRSPYVKWSKEEDDLLAQAVAKYGQKWDLVQKALPSRGYHQVRQRWLRKLGVFDSKPDLSSFQTAATTFSSTSHGDGIEPRGNPKLGLAPLSSERAFSGLAGRPPSLPS